MTTAITLASHNLGDLRIDSDAGMVQNGAFVNIAADVSGLDIKIGEIGVTASGTAGTTGIRRGGDDSNYNAILIWFNFKNWSNGCECSVRCCSTRGND